jgi:choline dehydrogenase
VGVPPLANLPGVGTGLVDQPGAVILAVPAPSAGAVDEPTLQVLARLDTLPVHPPDRAFYLCLFTGMDLTSGPLSGLVGMIDSPVANLAMLGDTRMASRGRMALRSPDPAEPPSVDLRFYTAKGDLTRMRAAHRHAWEIANHASFSATVERFALIDDALVADDDQLDGLLRAPAGPSLSGTNCGSSDRNSPHPPTPVWGVLVPISANPSLSNRFRRVESDQVAVPSFLRSGAAWAVATIGARASAS